jgi:Spy/CpxP family protein refolding chaperone
MLKNMRLFAVAGLVAAVVALAVVAAPTETAPLSADRGTRADSDGYTQLAWGGDFSTQRSGR